VEWYGLVASTGLDKAEASLPLLAMLVPLLILLQGVRQ
jgi:hypothetical protein